MANYKRHFKLDLAGSIIGYIHILGRSSKRRNYWVCQCNCGTIFEVITGDLRRKDGKHRQSCGCQKNTRNGDSHKDSEYGIWTGMIHRCNSQDRKDYKYYGGRGIYVDSSWMDYHTFKSDMGPRPSPSHTLDRKDNDGPYCRGNCRWATKLEQGSNQKSNVNLTFKGNTRCVAEWARVLGITKNTIYSRIRYGWKTADILTKPVVNPKRRSQE